MPVAAKRNLLNDLRSAGMPIEAAEPQIANICSPWRHLTDCCRVSQGVERLSALEAEDHQPGQARSQHDK